MYTAGLRDIEGFSHLLIISYLHLMQGYTFDVTPFMDTQTHGVFATRSPRRPNPIGLSIVRLTHVKDSTLYIEEVDLVDGTPRARPILACCELLCRYRIGIGSVPVGKLFERPPPIAA